MLSPGEDKSRPVIPALWKALPKRRKTQIVGLFALSVLASVLEIVSLGMLFPLLALLADGEGRAQVFVDRFFGSTPLAASGNLVPTILFLFSAAAILAGSVRLAVLYGNNRFSYAVASELAERVYAKLLYEPYVVHISRNSSVLIDLTVSKTLQAGTSVLSAAMTLATATIVGSGILVALLLTDPIVAVATACLFGGMYWLLSRFSRTQLRRNSGIISRHSVLAIRAVQEGLGGIRDVIIDGAQSQYVETFRKADRPAKAALARNVVVAGAPRFVVETIGMIFIALLAFFLSQRDGGLIDAIPTLGILALGAQRLLPLLHQGYSSLASIRGSEASMQELLAYLDSQPISVEPVEKLAFKSDIRLDRIGFHYPGSDKPVLQDVSLHIPKGARVGVFGPTGGGKSTMLDIVMGLLTPSAGTLRIDGTVIDAATQPRWRRNVAHVPQAIFLADCSIAENIAFGGTLDFDIDRIREAARLAQLHDTIEALAEGYDTIVGERGVRLSGGQRQRVGIARALYKRSELIILDEATSALDNDTEAALMGALAQLSEDVTVIMVAHRLTTLKNCDMVIDLAGGQIRRTGSYAELIEARQAIGEVTTAGHKDQHNDQPSDRP